MKKDLHKMDVVLAQLKVDHEQNRGWEKEVKDIEAQLVRERVHSRLARKNSKF